jgi:DNA-binding transcriptional ArsR family regulator
MLLRLEREPELSVGELARQLPIKLPTVLKHLNVLREAGLVRREKRGRTVRISLTPEPLRAATDWLARYERFWSSSLDRLAEIAEAREAGGAPAGGQEGARPPGKP